MQQTLREDPPQMRGQTPPAAHASPTGPPPGWRALGRTLAIAAMFGGFLSFVRVHTAFNPESRLVSLAHLVAVSWVGAGLGFLFHRWAERWPWIRGHRWREALAAGALMATPMGLIVWAGDRILAPQATPWDAIPGYLVISAVISLFMNLFIAVLTRHRTVVVVQGQADPPKFLERLPLRLRGAEVWAVEAEDHYLRLHTSKGQDLILLRLADAISELEGIEGAQVHRSWWVARDAIVGAERGDGRATLTLKDGSQVPVSRTFARTLREKRWI